MLSCVYLGMISFLDLHSIIASIRSLYGKPARSFIPNHFKQLSFDPGHYNLGFLLKFTHLINLVYQPSHPSETTYIPPNTAT